MTTRSFVMRFAAVLGAVMTLPAAAGAAASDGSTFTFTVPVQLTAISPSERPIVSCAVASGTEVVVGISSEGLGGGTRMFGGGRKTDGTPGEVLGSREVAVPMTGSSFSGNVQVVVSARTPALAATAHSYACVVLFNGMTVQQKYSPRTGYLYDNATLRATVKGTLQ